MRLRTWIVIVAATVMPACASETTAPEAASPTTADVATAPVVSLSVAERLEAGGVIAAGETAVLSSRVVATVTHVLVRAGDRVKAGDVIVRLDARDLTAQARHADAVANAAEKQSLQARATRDSAEAEHRLATAWHARITALHSKSSATDQERDEADARLAGATARLTGAQAAIDSADAGVQAARAAAGVATTAETFSVIRAPFDGLTTERLTDPGNLAAPGTPLVRIESAGERRVDITVDKSRASYIKPGDQVDVEIDGDESSALARVKGRVTEVARTVASDHRAFTVKVLLPSDVRARSGMFARVRFDGRSRPTLVIPDSAVRRHGQVTTVYVVENGVARLRLVQVGSQTPAGTPVLAGLGAGEIVVLAPSQVVDGQRVTALSGNPAGGKR